MRVKCGTFPPYDSWLLIDTAGFKILNLNDCQVKTPEVARMLLKQTGPIDVLLSQFSYACWVGNPEDREGRRRAARRALEQVSYQIEVLKPRYFIPSASFILFSHEENQYLNDSINRVDAVLEFLKKYPDVKAFSMYPGDTWTVGSQYDGNEALSKYAHDYERGVQSPHRSESVTFGDLEEVAEKHLVRLREKNNWNCVKMAAMPPARLFGEVSVFLTDCSQTVRFDIFRGLRLAPELKGDDADIAMTSASLAFVLKFEWGFDTLYVNARFRASGEGFRRFERSISLALLNNTGRAFGPSLLLDPSFCYAAARHFSPKIGAILKRRL